VVHFCAFGKISKYYFKKRQSLLNSVVVGQQRPKTAEMTKAGGGKRKREGIREYTERLIMLENDLMALLTANNNNS
jgi:hypothetical protein